MKRWLWLGILGLLLFATHQQAWAQCDPSPCESAELATLLVANNLYQQGNYAEAASVYQQLVDQNFADADLFFNLGNAYYKNGELGKAIVNYRRAERLSPRDGDLTDNLARVISEREDTIPEGGAGPIAAIANATRWLSSAEIAIFPLLLWVGWAGLVLLYRRRRISSIQSLLIGATVSLLLSLIIWGSHLYVDRTRPAAVVVLPEYAVRVDPLVSAETAFILNDGAEVAIIEARDTWSQIEVAGDVQGWILNEAIETVTKK